MSEAQQTSSMSSNTSTVIPRLELGNGLVGDLLQLRNCDTQESY